MSIYKQDTCHVMYESGGVHYCSAHQQMLGDTQRCGKWWAEFPAQVLHHQSRKAHTQFFAVEKSCPVKKACRKVSGEKDGCFLDLYFLKKNKQGSTLGCLGRLSAGSPGSIQERKGRLLVGYRGWQSFLTSTKTPTWLWETALWPDVG